MSRHDLANTTERTVQIEVPKEIIAEVALRAGADASDAEIRGLLHDHIDRTTEFVTTDGTPAVDIIQGQD